MVVAYEISCLLVILLLKLIQKIRPLLLLLNEMMMPSYHLSLKRLYDGGGSSKEEQ